MGWTKRLHANCLCLVGRYPPLRNFFPSYCPLVISDHLSPSLTRIFVCVLQVSGGPWVRKMFRMNPQPSLKDSLVTFLWRKA